MSKAKALKLENIRAHFFMSIIGNQVDLVYHDHFENGAGLGAALSGLLEEDDKLFDIFSAAFLTAIENRDDIKLRKEKYSSKKGNILPKIVKKQEKKK